jgi:hypothetical protein
VKPGAVCRPICGSGTVGVWNRTRRPRREPSSPCPITFDPVSPARRSSPSDPSTAHQSSSSPPPTGIPTTKPARSATPECPSTLALLHLSTPTPDGWHHARSSTRSAPAVSVHATTRPSTRTGVSGNRTHATTGMTRSASRTAASPSSDGVRPIGLAAVNTSLIAAHDGSPLLIPSKIRSTGDSRNRARAVEFRWLSCLIPAKLRRKRRPQ